MYRIVNRKKLLMTRIADAIGNLVFGVFRCSGTVTAIIPESVKRILVIRTAYLGDVMMTVPMLKPLKSRFPDAHISFLTSTAAAPLLENNPDIDAVLELNPFWFYSGRPIDYLVFIQKLRHNPFDLIIEARGDIRELLLLVFPLKARYKLSYAVGGGAFVLTHVVPHPHVNHRVDYHLDMVKYLGGKADRNHLEWEIFQSPEEKSRIQSILDKEGIRTPFWCAHPGSRLPLKRWMNDRYAAAFDQISEKIQRPLVLLGAYSEVVELEKIADRLKHRPHILSGIINLRDVSGILRRSSLFVCNDSAPMHIAAAAKTPTVAIFGPSKSAQTGPCSPLSSVVEKACACRDRCDEQTCTDKTYHYCMKSISVKDVVAAALDLWLQAASP